MHEVDMKGDNAIGKISIVLAQKCAMQVCSVALAWVP